VVFSFLVLSACYYPQIAARPQPRDSSAAKAAPPPYTIEPTPRRIQDGIYHPVGKGETLWRICKTYNVSLQEVAELNSITDASQIKTGDRIFIPGARQIRAIDLSEGVWQKEPESIQQPRGRFIWPVEGKIVGHYGMKKNLKYDGIDIQAPAGTVIKAADAGKVAFVNTLPGYGNIIIIKHRDKYSTVYAHNQLNLAKEGSWVSQGAVIARLGNSHDQASSPTLHFQIRRYNKARNPLFYLH
jgi:murein DD-endopeptidase MepM/ murein hydrolase activator NlpD